MFTRQHTRFLVIAALGAMALVLLWQPRQRPEGMLSADEKQYRSMFPITRYTRKCTQPNHAWDIYANTCVKSAKTQEPNPILLKWPSTQTTKFDALVNAYKVSIANTHKTSVQEVEDKWGVYYNSVRTGGDGLCYILRKTNKPTNVHAVAVTAWGA